LPGLPWPLVRPGKQACFGQPELRRRCFTAALLMSRPTRARQRIASAPRRWRKKTNYWHAKTRPTFIRLMQFSIVDNHTRFASEMSDETGKDAKLKYLIAKFMADEAGATAIEYGLIAAGIALAIIEVIYALGTNLVDKLTQLLNLLK
jgi:pilus assembly protein Flp/PilA